jgi:hypothetical protein
MSVTAFNVNTAFNVITCSHDDCCAQFAVPADVQATWRKNGTTFYCPYGHQSWYGEGSIAKLTEQLDAAQQALVRERQHTAAALAREKMALHRERAQKAAKTKLKNRIKHGVCPCCTRTFQDLAKHMQTKHPDYNGAKDNN